MASVTIIAPPENLAIFRIKFVLEIETGEDPELPPRNKAPPGRTAKVQG